MDATTVYTSSGPIGAVLERLDGVRKQGSGYLARCPAHDDRHASLSIGTGNDGRVLLRCHAGCPVRDIVSSLRLQLSDLFPPREGTNGNGHGHHNGNGRRKQYATFQAATQAGERVTGGRFTHAWSYHDRDGKEVFRVARFDTADGGKKCLPFTPGAGVWEMRDPHGPLPLYRLPDLSEGDPVFVVEGEKCADAAVSLGLTATTSSHGARSAAGSDWRPLAGREVVILPDNDEPGERYAVDVCRLLCALDPPARAKLVKLPNLPPHGDIVEFIEAGGTAEDVLRLTAGAPPFRPDADPATNTIQLPEPLTVRQLMQRFPTLRPPIIHGLLRRGETMNVIAPQKIGKSWLVIDLALSIATGRTWLGTYRCEPGEVLIFDNELHGETATYRLPVVAQARGILTDEFADRISVVNLRGYSVDLRRLDHYIKRYKPGRFNAVVLDAWYRFLPIGSDENDNGNVTELYNLIDSYAARLDCPFVMIHHSSKGNQSDKSVTDVGSGAGAQSRAADTHLILRHHETEGAIVLDAAARSWPPIDPTCLRWCYPVWRPAPELNPEDLKRQKKSGGKRAAAAPEKEPDPELTLDALVTRFVADEPRSVDLIIQNAREAGFKNKAEVRRLVKVAAETRLIFNHGDPNDRNRPARYSTREPMLADVAAAHAQTAMTRPQAKMLVKRLAGLFPSQVTEEQAKTVAAAFMRLTNGRAERVIDEAAQLEKFDLSAVLKACDEAGKEVSS